MSNGPNVTTVNEGDYRDLVEHSPEAVLVATDGEQIAFANTTMRQLCGARKLEEIVGHRLQEFVHPDSRLLIENRLRHLMETGERTPAVQEKWIRRDGSVLEVEETAAPLEWHGQAGVQVILREVSKDSHDDHESRQVRWIVEKMEDYAIFSLDVDAHISSWNSGAERLFGYRQEEVLGHGLELLYTPEDRARHVPEEKIHQALQHGVAEDERWHVRKDGGRFFALGILKAIRDESGQLRGFTKVSRDYTHRKLMEDELAESAASFRLLADALPQIVWSIQADGSIDFLNRNWYEFTGFTEQNTPRMPEDRWRAILHPEDVESTLHRWRDSLRTGRPFQFEYRYKDRKQGGYRWYLGRAHPVKDPQGKIIRWFGTCTDIDDNKRWECELEERVLERTLRLEEVNKSLESFSYSIAHDLQAPLRYIRSYNEALLEEYGSRLDETGRDYAQRSIIAAERMNTMIRDLLAFSRLSRGEISMGWVNAQTVLETVLSELNDRIERQQANIEVARPLPAVWASSIVLEQILSNLIRNGLKFVKAGQKPHIRIWAEEAPESIRLWVRDNGIGIHPKDQERIFGVFQRLHPQRAFPGTGIGLAIVQKGVERMGGRLGVESNEGEGSAFWIELPHPKAPGSKASS